MTVHYSHPAEQGWRKQVLTERSRQTMRWIMEKIRNFASATEEHQRTEQIYHRHE